MTFLAAALPYVAAATAVYGAYTSYTTAQAAKNAPKPPPPPAAPEMPVAMTDPQIAQGGNVARQRAIAAGGIMANIATGPQGLTGSPSTTGKTLLGQ